jgi:predicted MFS family arabinose efflux permease
MGLTFLPGIGIPATYFSKKRALATGLVTSGASIGGILYPIIVEKLLSEVGFRWTPRVVALISLATLSAACVLVRQRRDLPPKAKYPLIQLKALSDPQYSYLVFGMLCSFVGCYVPYYYIQTRVQEAAIDLRGLDSFYLVSFLSAGGIFGRIIPNYVADK